MKKLWVLLLLGLSFPAGAEIVSTISYNPARMGQYDYLKVSKDAVFKGGFNGLEVGIFSRQCVDAGRTDTVSGQLFLQDTLRYRGAADISHAYY